MCALFSLEHGLNCTNGGTSVDPEVQEVRDLTGQLAALAIPHVTEEPVVRHGPGDEDGLICDLAGGARSLESAETEALLDVRVVNTDA